MGTLYKSQNKNEDTSVLLEKQRELLYNSKNKFDNSLDLKKDGVLKGLVSIKKYREIVNDHESSEEHIIKRISFLRSFCRSVIRQEINKYKNNKI